MAERDLARLLAGLAPRLDPDPWVFVTHPTPLPVGLAPLMIFREAEGITAVLSPSEARALGLPEYLNAENSKIYFPGTTGRPERPGNIWTGATFGVFAIRDGAETSKPADFDYLRVTPAP